MTNSLVEDYDKQWYKRKNIHCFNNISVILCGRVVEEIGVPGENHQTGGKSLTNFIT
jgi:hypothetical protein